MSNTVSVSVAFGLDPAIVTVRLSGNSSPIVCTAVATDEDADGQVKRVFLRERIIHTVEDIDWEGWKPGGATTTVLTRIEGAA